MHDRTCLSLLSLEYHALTLKRPLHRVLEGVDLPALLLTIEHCVCDSSTRGRVKVRVEVPVKVRVSCGYYGVVRGACVWCGTRT